MMGALQACVPHVRAATWMGGAALFRSDPSPLPVFRKGGPLENRLAGRDLLRLMDLTPAEVALALETAARQKAAWAAGEHDAPLAGKAVAIIMEKPSLRTRNSFEIGAYRLGAYPGVMADDHSAFSRGETVEDTVKVLQNFYDCIVLRTFAQSKIEEVARWADVPVINALTDAFHPCQILADLLTIREHKGCERGLTMAYVGDGNNMANTYLEAGALTGMHVRVASPAGFEVDRAVFDECVDAAARFGTGAELALLRDPVEAVRGADIVVTDTWTSMGDEEQHDARVAAFQGYQVNADLMAHAGEDAIFMHCLPAHRGEEVTDEVMSSPCSVIYDEAGNRLHAQKAVMALLMGVPAPEGALEAAAAAWGDVR